MNAQCLDCQEAGTPCVTCHEATIKRPHPIGRARWTAIKNFAPRQDEHHEEAV